MGSDALVYVFDYDRYVTGVVSAAKHLPSLRAPRSGLAS